MLTRSCQTAPSRKTLRDLGLMTARDLDLQVTGICANSRLAAVGNLFAALSGTNVHGAEFAGEAISKGVAAILTDSDGAQILSHRSQESDVDVIVVDEPRKCLAETAARWFGRAPDIAVAVTGTNGKSSVVSMCRQIWDGLGRPAASFGTLGVEGIDALPVHHTTPDPLILHELLAELHDSGITHISLEASSHGLDQQRLAGLRIVAAAFTNLTHDHLDYHGSMDSYFEAKARLFNDILPPDGVAVIWVDGKYGKELARMASRRGLEVLTMGKANSDVRITSQEYSKGGQAVKFDWQGQTHVTELAFPGDFQAKNALTAAALVVVTGEPLGDVIDKLRLVRTVRGRLELAATRQNGSPVYVDYAHTPDALETVIRSLRQHHMGRMVVVFGAGGERDLTKRVPMGEAVAKFADVALVTDDNPRGEEPGAIRAEILKGCPNGIEISDRAEAILRGVDMLAAGDVLLIAGKGHENGQEIDGVVHPFNDVEQASMAVRALDGLTT